MADFKWPKSASFDPVIICSSGGSVFNAGTCDTLVLSWWTITQPWNFSITGARCGFVFTAYGVAILFLQRVAEKYFCAAQFFWMIVFCGGNVNLDFFIWVWPISIIYYFGNPAFGGFTKNTTFCFTFPSAGNNYSGFEVSWYSLESIFASLEGI